MPEIAPRIHAAPLDAKYHHLAAALAEELSMAAAVIARDVADVEAGTTLYGLRAWLHRKLREKSTACVKCLVEWDAGQTPDLLDWTTALSRVERPTDEELARLDAEERAAAQAAEDAEDDAADEARRRAKKGGDHAG